MNLINNNPQAKFSRFCVTIKGNLKDNWQTSTLEVNESMNSSLVVSTCFLIERTGSDGTKIKYYNYKK